MDKAITSAIAGLAIGIVFVVGFVFMMPESESFTPEAYAAVSVDPSRVTIEPNCCDSGIDDAPAIQFSDELKLSLNK